MSEFSMYIFKRMIFQLWMFRYYSRVTMDCESLFAMLVRCRWEKNYSVDLTMMMVTDASSACIVVVENVDRVSWGFSDDFWFVCIDNTGGKVQWEWEKEWQWEKEELNQERFPQWLDDEKTTMHENDRVFNENELQLISSQWTNHHLPISTRSTFEM